MSVLTEIYLWSACVSYTAMSLNMYADSSQRELARMSNRQLAFSVFKFLSNALVPILNTITAAGMVLALLLKLFLYVRKETRSNRSTKG